MVKITFLVQNLPLKFTKEVYFLLGYPVDGVVVELGYPVCTGIPNIDIFVSVQVLHEQVT